MTTGETTHRRRTVLKTIGGTSVTLGVGTGVAVAKKKGKGRKGGAGFTFTEPTVDTFTITDESASSDETFQRGCGKGGKLQSYSFFHVVDSFDGDGETDRLYPHPSDKRFGEGQFEINDVCETETGRDRPAYWVNFAPY
ncbi:hypothetical protein [Haloplanus salilacus]|uniref:hypothetical protein n=1 Tax=Haloplanus salilacus TaxID=2949994 RepID=UPI0030D02D3D